MRNLELEAPVTKEAIQIQNNVICYRFNSTIDRVTTNTQSLADYYDFKNLWDYTYHQVFLSSTDDEAQTAINKLTDLYNQEPQFAKKVFMDIFGLVEKSTQNTCNTSIDTHGDFGKSKGEAIISQ